MGEGVRSSEGFGGGRTSVGAMAEAAGVSQLISVELLLQAWL